MTRKSTSMGICQHDEMMSCSISYYTPPYLLAELVRGQPGDCLTFDLGLIVDTLDGEEGFSERL